MSLIKKFLRCVCIKIIHFILSLFSYPLEIEKKRYSFKYQNLSIFVKTSSLLTYRRWVAFQNHGKEKDTLNWIDSFEDEKIFYDIGANVGVFSIYANIKKKMKVYSFEPEPNSFIELYNTIGLNNLNIVPLKIALDFDENTKYFNMIDFESGISESFLSDKIEKKTNFLISTNSLDKVISQKKIKFPNYIKIDVDGNEMNILKGMSKTLENKELKSMLVEIEKTNKENILNYLKNFSFKLESKSDNGNYIFKR